MNKPLILTLLVVFSISLFSPATADEIVLKNDSIVDINDATLVADFLAGEHVGVRLTSPSDGAIVAVQILWKGFFPGDIPRLEQAIYIYDEGVFPTPGTQLAQIETPLMVADVWNEFRHLDPGQTVPLSVPVNEGDSFYVTLQFANATSIGTGQASIVRDIDGCQPNRNVAFVIPGGWYDICLLGVTGDLVIRAVIESGSLCPVKLPTDINGDCYVNFLDLALVAASWLDCNNQFDSNCI